MKTVLMLVLVAVLAWVACARERNGQPSGSLEEKGISTGKAVKIRTLTVPTTDPSTFDPGSYVSSLEFYETAESITEAERDGLAQFLQVLAYIALEAGSDRWAESRVERDTSAFLAMESHFGHLEGWALLGDSEAGISYRELANFLIQHYPPHSPQT